MPFKLKAMPATPMTRVDRQWLADLQEEFVSLYDLLDQALAGERIRDVKKDILSARHMVVGLDQTVCYVLNPDPKAFCKAGGSRIANDRRKEAIK